MALKMKDVYRNAVLGAPPNTLSQTHTHTHSHQHIPEHRPKKDRNFSRAFCSFHLILSVFFQPPFRLFIVDLVVIFAIRFLRGVDLIWGSSHFRKLENGKQLPATLNQLMLINCFVTKLLRFIIVRAFLLPLRVSLCIGVSVCWCVSF